MFEDLRPRQLERQMAELSEQMRTDATFGRMTGLGDESSMDRLELMGIWLHADNTDVPDDDAENVDPWTSDRCWQCTRMRGDE